MQLLGSTITPNIVNRSPWGFASTDQAKGGGRRRKSKANRRKSAKNKTRKRYPIRKTT